MCLAAFYPANGLSTEPNLTMRNVYYIVLAKLYLYVYNNSCRAGREPQYSFYIRCERMLSKKTKSIKTNAPKHCKKSRIWETKHLSTDADSSTDPIGGWTKNTPKPDFFEKQTIIIKNA